MRIIIYGAGGIGGGIGARLALAGHEVVLICRGQHLEAINSRGLLLKAPDGEWAPVARELLARVTQALESTSTTVPPTSSTKPATRK